VEELHKKAVESAETLAEEESRATEAITKTVIEQERERSRIAEELAKEKAEHTKKMAALVIGVLRRPEASTVTP